MIDHMEKEVVENFRSLTSRGSEIGGLLLGTVSPGNPAIVSIDDFELISCDYSRGPLYRLSDADMGRFERAMQQRQGGNSPLVVGYFRSHTRKGLSLDAEDVAFLEARFRDPHQVALLVRPYATKASTAGIFIWEGGQLQGDASYLEFPFRSSQLSSFRPSSLLAEAPPPPPPITAPPASAAAPLPAAPKTAVRAQIVPIASRREINLPAPPPPADPTPKEPVATAAPPAAPAPVKTPAEPAAKPAVKVETAAPAASVKPAVKIETAVPAAPAKPAPAASAKPAVAEPSKPAPAVAAKPAVAEPPKPVVEPPKPAVKEKEKEKAAAVETKPAAKVEPKKVEAETAAALAEPVKEEKSKMGMIIGIVAAIAFILVGLFVYPGFLKHATIPVGGQAGSALSLSTERTGADILVTWNRDSAAIKNATHAVLSIFDGDRHESYEMDLGQLRDGKIMYSPITADVSFRLDVNQRGKGEPVTDSVRVLRTRPSPMGDDAQQAGQPAKTPATTTAPKPAQPTAITPDAPVDTPPVEETKPAVTAAPTKPFDASSLVQRLRPAPAPSETLDAPSINPGVTPNAGSATISGLNLNGTAPAPTAPAPPPSVTKAPEKKAAVVSGGQIKQAELVFRKEPEYPKLARQMGVKGVVELTATIGIDGKVKGVKIEHGHPLLTKAASDAVLQWIYKPTLLNGQPVQNDTRITLNFMGEK